MLDGLKFHLVSKCLFRRQDMLSLQVAVHHRDNGFLVGKITDDHGHCFHTERAAGSKPSVSGNQLISAAVLRTCQRRSKNAGIGNALHQLGHFFIVLHLERVILKGRKLCQRNLLDLWFPDIRTFLIVHEQLIVAGQSQINYLVFLHKIIPFCCNQRS